MSDDLRYAVAMLFRQRGRRSMTEKEFLFGASIDLHWFPYPVAQKMLDATKAAGLVIEDNGQLKPGFDVSTVDVPVGFHPDKDMLKNAAPKKKEEGLFPRLVALAECMGINKRDFISQCNRIQDHMDVDIEVASLLVLQDRGGDVRPYLEEAGRLVKDR